MADRCIRHEDLEGDTTTNCSDLDKAIQRVHAPQRDKAPGGVPAAELGAERVYPSIFTSSEEDGCFRFDVWSALTGKSTFEEMVFAGDSM